MGGRGGAEHMFTTNSPSIAIRPLADRYGCPLQPAPMFAFSTTQVRAADQEAERLAQLSKKQAAHRQAAAMWPDERARAWAPPHIAFSPHQQPTLHVGSWQGAGHGCLAGGEVWGTARLTQGCNDSWVAAIAGSVVRQARVRGCSGEQGRRGKQDCVGGAVGSRRARQNRQPACQSMTTSYSWAHLNGSPLRFTAEVTKIEVHN